MKKFKLLQVQINKDSDVYKAVNKDTPNKREDELRRAYYDCVTGMGVSAALGHGLFAHVANLQAPSLELTFEVGNLGPEEQITRYAPMHSLSVGNIVVDEDNKAFSCEHMGWKALDEADYAHLNRISLHS